MRRRLKRMRSGTLQLVITARWQRACGDRLGARDSRRVSKGVLCGIFRMLAARLSFRRTTSRDRRIARGAVEHIMTSAKNGLTIQRCKGLGEMNPSSSGRRRSIPRREQVNVQVNDAVETDEMFTVLMGDAVSLEGIHRRQRAGCEESGYLECEQNPVTRRAEALNPRPFSYLLPETAMYR
jgi:hypothetical protein